MRMGVICSSGGSAFFTAVSILREAGYEPDCRVVTDRVCGAEAVAREFGIPVIRIEEKERVAFSRSAADWLYGEQSVEWVCLHFTRLVSSEIYLRGPCINIHPSLLPAYPGFGAIEKALTDGARFIGATAHLVDQSVDGGRLLAQVIAPISSGLTPAAAHRLSFAQKVYLQLVLFEASFRQDLADLANVAMVTGRASPALRDGRLESAFNEFLMAEGIQWRV